MNCVRKYNLKSVNITKRAEASGLHFHHLSSWKTRGWMAFDCSDLMFSSDLKMKKSLSNGDLDKRILSSLFVPFTFYC